MTGCCGKMTVAPEQRCVERFNKGEAPADVDSLANTLAGFPAATAATSDTAEPIRLGDAHNQPDQVRS
jgi:hypothetical protein